MKFLPNVTFAKKMLWLITLLFFLFCIILFFIHFSNFMDSFTTKDYIPDRSWVEIPGSFSKYSHVPKGTECAFDYVYNGRKYDRISSGGYDIDKYYAKIGDKFMLKINPKSPEKYLPIRWKPLFLPKEKTSLVPGIILNIKRSEKSSFFLFRNYFHKQFDSPFSKYRIGFSYEVSSISYEKGQYLSPYLDSLNEKIKIRQKFEVEYLIDNPQRAIIHIDKSIK